jgi:tetratricopeptide (TPR) repeat protein
LFKDAYDLDVTCASDAALQAFLSAMDCSLRFDRTAIEEFGAAIELDEEFAIAHAALGRQLFMLGHSAESATHFKKAVSLANSATSRERDAIQIANGAVRGDPQTIAMARAHVERYPTDVFVLAHLLGPFGLLAFSGITDWSEQNIALLRATKARYRADDWWHLTTEGFFAAEEGRLMEASKICERAWGISENGNCAHSLAHLHFEACVLDEGRDFIREWVAEYGDHSNMRHHLLWHLAMIDLESGLEMSDVFETYDLEFYPATNGPSPLEMLCDNASFLWRCHLAGVEIPVGVCDEVNQYAESHFGFFGFAFADAHKAMASALQPSTEKHETLVAHLSEFASSANTDVAEFITQYSGALGAFAKGEYARAVGILEPFLSSSILIGGSNPQRRIIEETFVEACVRAADYDKADAVLRRRNRKNSVFDQNQHSRIGRLKG